VSLYVITTPLDKIEHMFYCSSAAGRIRKRKKGNDTMPRMSKKDKLYWAFFIDPATGRRKFNHVCRCCTHSCMQSFRAELICCPDYLGKRSKAGRTGSETGKGKRGQKQGNRPVKGF
jgi:hypothetical protein